MPKIVPVQVDRIWDKRHTSKDYSGTGTSRYIPTARITLLTRHKEKELKLSNYPWLKKRYENEEKEVIGDRIAAIVKEDGEIMVFGESKESLKSFEEEDL